MQPSDEGTLNLPTRMLDSSLALSRKQRKVFEFLKENPAASASLTVKQVAEALTVNPSTVVRAAKTLGYEGYGELKRDLRYAYLHGLNPLDLLHDHQARVPSGDFVLAQLTADLENLKELVAGCDPAKIHAFAKEILRAQRVLVVSTGSYAALGHVLTHQLSFIGLRLDLEVRGGSHLVHSIAHLGAGAMVIGIGFWRGSLEVVKAVTWARDAGARVGVITDNPHSRLARSAHNLLTAPSESTSYFQSITSGMALIYAVINAIWLLDTPRFEQAVLKSQQMYLEFGVTTDS